MHLIRDMLPSMQADTQPVHVQSCSHCGRVLCVEFSLV